MKAYSQENQRLTTRKRRFCLSLQACATLGKERTSENIPRAKPTSDRCSIGLKNLGSTCYINVILQMLCFSSVVRKRLAISTGELTTNPLRNHLIAMLQVMADRNEQLQDNVATRTTTPIVPTAFIEALHSYHRQVEVFHAKKQQDAHEFLLKLIEECDLGIDSISSLGQLFHGNQVTQVRCFECDRRIDRSEPFSVWSISLQMNESVQKALDRSTSCEILQGHNKYLCSECNCRIEATRQVQISESPSLFCLHVHHLSSASTTTTFNPICPTLHLKSHEYTLQSIIYRTAMSSMTGHYTILQRETPFLSPSSLSCDRSWMIMDDDTVLVFSPDELEAFFRLNQRLPGVVGTPVLLLYARESTS